MARLLSKTPLPGHPAVGSSDRNGGHLRRSHASQDINAIPQIALTFSGAKKEIGSGRRLHLIGSSDSDRWFWRQSEGRAGRTAWIDRDSRGYRSGRTIARRHWPRGYGECYPKRSQGCLHRASCSGRCRRSCWCSRTYTEQAVRLRIAGDYLCRSDDRARRMSNSGWRGDGVDDAISPSRRRHSFRPKNGRRCDGGCHGCSAQRSV